MRWKVLVILNLISLVAMIVVNVMANTLPINGMNTGKLSDLYPNEFVPAGYTFSIWGIIYSLLLGFGIYQAGAFTRASRQVMVNKLGWLFISLNVLNASWIFAWHYRQVTLSVLIMFSILLTLILIHLKLPIPDRQKTTQEKIWVQAPFSIYLGWIMTATIANITAWLVDSGWHGGPFSQTVWTILMIAVAGTLSLAFLFGRKNVLIPCVTIWSIVGIITRQSELNGFNSIAVTGAVVCSVLLVAILVALNNRSNYIPS